LAASLRIGAGERGNLHKVVKLIAAGMRDARKFSGSAIHHAPTTK
jgi:hypothetical protein